MVQAQELDTADRYLNSKCAKYLLRAGLIKEAEELCAKFTREGVGASESLTDMQCMWFEMESAKAFLKLGKYGEALKKCHQIERVIILILEIKINLSSSALRQLHRGPIRLPQL
jgi:peptide alpha-N-acetyltransferase